VSNSTYETFTVNEARIDLYPVDENGEPIEASPVFLGAQAKGLRISEQLTIVTDYPSGAQYGEPHHVDERHTIEFTQTFVVSSPRTDPPSDISLELAATDVGQPFSVVNATTYKLRRNQKYVATIVWQDSEDPTKYYYRCYYGVHDISHEIGGSGDVGEKSQNIVWGAQYFLEQ
jgi:hypothetical protein